MIWKFPLELMTLQNSTVSSVWPCIIVNENNFWLASHIASSKVHILILKVFSNNCCSWLHKVHQKNNFWSQKTVDTIFHADWVCFNLFSYDKFEWHHCIDCYFDFDVCILNPYFTTSNDIGKKSSPCLL